MKKLLIALVLAGLAQPAFASDKKPKHRVGVVVWEGLTAFPSEYAKKTVREWEDALADRGFEPVRVTNKDWIKTGESWDYFGTAQILIIPTDIDNGGRVVTEMGVVTTRNVTTVSVDIFIPSIDEVAVRLSKDGWAGFNARDTYHLAINGVCKEFDKWYKSNREALDKALSQ